MDSNELFDNRTPLDPIILPILSRPVPSTPTWILESERLQYFREIEEPKATALVMAHGESREIGLTKPTLPICNWTSQSSHVTNSWMQDSWMQSEYAKPPSDLSQLLMEDSMVTTDRVNLPSTLEQKIQFIPRPAAEYDVIMKGVNTGHHDHRKVTMSDPATVASSHTTSTSLQEDQATSQSHWSGLRREHPEHF
jgi:hypothetical protein